MGTGEIEETRFIELFQRNAIRFTETARPGRVAGQTNQRKYFRESIRFHGNLAERLVELQRLRDLWDNSIDLGPESVIGEYRRYPHDWVECKKSGGESWQAVKCFGSETWVIKVEMWNCVEKRVDEFVFELPGEIGVIGEQDPHSKLYDDFMGEVSRLLEH